MKMVSNRQLRRTVVAQQNALEDGVAPALRNFAREHDSLAKRVDALEAPTTFTQRLRWLLTGRHGA